ncbi:Ureidoglycolate lyase [Cladobotryum mycophilum]|uniref:Ureidoglycolate lyase n=1 Tax=Cladobotryum mycophilum TaxID=491253 RepID=A0ABR0S543_9HYPO
MAQKIHIGHLNLQIVAEPLTRDAFAPFGDVIQNPRPDAHPSTFYSYAESLPQNASSANQGTAIKYANVSRLRNLYHQAPSRRSEPVMSMFVCATQAPSSSTTDITSDLTVRFLERHPFTTQTFTPIRSSASAYLVIVAPSLPPTEEDEHLPVPSGDGLPGNGMPNLRGLRAFVASSGQAVTYGAGTWHAPMVTLGKAGTSLDFVVSQFSSGVPEEDCQLLEFISSSSEEPRIVVRIPHGGERVSKL